jgi:hypothetical protein
VNSALPQPGPAPAERLVFEDPHVKAGKTDHAAGLEIRFPLFEAAALPEILRAVRARAEHVFTHTASAEIQDAMDKLDGFFADSGRPEVCAVVDLVHRIDGFSKHDVERFGLGVFTRLLRYDRALIGRFVKQAFKTGRPVETAYGHLQRFGANAPFIRRREPGLLSHFASGNVAGYSAILTRIGLPFESGGAAQVIKLPSTSAVFPMIYLAKLGELAPDLRETMACGYWKGGDRAIEDGLLAASDAVNVLGSDATVREVAARARRLGRRPVVLGHGHKVGAAYISREFAETPALRDRVLQGLASDISAFDGAACYSTKNIYVQGDHRAFAARLIEALDGHARAVSPVNPAMRPVGRALGRVFEGSANVLASTDGSAYVRVADKPAFWIPDETYRYVQVMPAENMEAAAGVLEPARPLLQTVVIAVPDTEVLPALRLFGKAGASNIHYPGSAPFLNVYEEPHDGDFDFVKIRYPYRVRFAAANFKRNADWLGA